MARSIDLEGLRREAVKSLYGRRLGIDSNDHLVGPRSIRAPIFGISGNAGVTPSTSVTTVVNYGVQAMGSSAAGLSTGYTLSAPEPGIRKTLFAISTAYINITCSTGSFFVTTANSTGQVLMFERGIGVDLIGLSTSLWGIINNPISSLTTNASIT